MRSGACGSGLDVGARGMSHGLYATWHDVRETSG